MAQAPDWHILLMIGRKWSQNPWVLPVQFFGGPEVGEEEKELIVPPFTYLKMEDDLELRSGMDEKELRERALGLANRWELPKRKYAKRASKNPLGTLGEIVGPELWQLLTRKPGLVANKWDDETEITCAPRVTVRFVAEMQLRPAVRELFEDKSKMLLDFPASSSPEIPKLPSLNPIKYQKEWEKFKKSEKYGTKIRPASSPR